MREVEGANWWTETSHLSNGVAGDRCAGQEDRGSQRAGVKLRGLAGDKWRAWETMSYWNEFLPFLK